MAILADSSLLLLILLLLLLLLLLLSGPWHLLGLVGLPLLSLPFLLQIRLIYVLFNLFTFPRDLLVKGNILIPKLLIGQSAQLLKCQSRGLPPGIRYFLVNCRFAFCRNTVLTIITLERQGPSWMWTGWDRTEGSPPGTIVGHLFHSVWSLYFDHLPLQSSAGRWPSKRAQGSWGIHLILTVHCVEYCSIGCTCGIQPHSYLRILGSRAPGEKSFS